MTDNEPKTMTIKERLLERETRLLEKLEVVQSALRILAENPEFEKKTNTVLKADEQPEL